MVNQVPPTSEKSAPKNRVGEVLSEGGAESRTVEAAGGCDLPVVGLKPGARSPECSRVVQGSHLSVGPADLRVA